jgi:hypothetical protein
VTSLPCPSSAVHWFAAGHDTATIGDPIGSGFGAESPSADAEVTETANDTRTVSQKPTFANPRLAANHDVTGPP